jgi:hypothetical protein
VIFAGGVSVEAGVADADGQAPVPITITSPVCRRCARRTRPVFEFGLVTARLEIEIRRNGLLVEPVLWQIVSLAGDASVLAEASCPVATATSAASPSESRTTAEMSRRLIVVTPSNECCKVDPIGRQHLRLASRQRGLHLAPLSATSSGTRPGRSLTARVSHRYRARAPPQFAVRAPSARGRQRAGHPHALVVLAVERDFSGLRDHDRDGRALSRLEVLVEVLVID